MTFIGATPYTAGALNNRRQPPKRAHRGVPADAARQDGSPCEAGEGDERS